MQHVCVGCGAGFAHASSLCRHVSKKSCHFKARNRNLEEEDDAPCIDEIWSELLRLRKEVEQLKLNQTETYKGSTCNNNSNNNNIDNSTSNIIHININPFGREDTSHLTSDFLTTCVSAMDKGIVNLVKEKHFSNKIPSNCNLKVTSVKRKEIAIYNGKNWVVRPRQDILDQLTQVSTETLDNHFCDNEEQFKALTAYNRIDEFFEKARNPSPSFSKAMTEAVYCTLLEDRNKP